MKTFFTSVMVLLCIIGNLMHAHAQVQEAWAQQYLVPNPNSTLSIDIKTDGASVYVLARLYPDVLLFKYSNAGTLIWQQTYTSPAGGDDMPRDMAIDGAGNIYVVGTSNIYNGESTAETFTLKYNSDGTLLWSSRYLRPDNNRSGLNAVALDNYGNIYATGFTEPGPNSWDYDFLTIKYNAAGVQQWLRTFNGTNDGGDEGTLIGVDNANNVYVCGESDSKSLWQGLPLYMGKDYRTIKYDANGNTLWSKGTGTFRNDVPKAMAIDGLMNVYITGQGNGWEKMDYLTVKYNSTGSLLWTKSYNGAADEDDQAEGIAVTPSGECYVTGLSRETTTGLGHYGTVKYSAAGVQVWMKSYQPPQNQGAGAKAIALDGSGNIYVTGFCLGTDGGLEIATLKYSSSGIQSWMIVYTAHANDLPYGIAVYTPPAPTLLRPSVYLLGESYDFNTMEGNVVTVRYTQSPLVGPLSSQAVANYPNPFASSTTIVYELTDESEVTLQIVDVRSGRPVESISLGKQNAGEQRYVYQPANLPKGNYAYRLVAASANGERVQSSVMQRE